MHGTVVDSILQLSPPAYRHSKGRQLVSMTRRAEVVQLLLDLLSQVVVDAFNCSNWDTMVSTSNSLEHRYKVCLNSVFAHFMGVCRVLIKLTNKTLPQTCFATDSFMLLSGISQCLYNLGSAEIGFIQCFTVPEQQVSIFTCYTI